MTRYAVPVTTVWKFGPLAAQGRQHIKVPPGTQLLTIGHQIGEYGLIMRLYVWGQVTMPGGRLPEAGALVGELEERTILVVPTGQPAEALPHETLRLLGRVDSTSIVGPLVAHVFEAS